MYRNIRVTLHNHGSNTLVDNLGYYCTLNSSYIYVMLSNQHNIQEYFSSVFASYLYKPPQLKITDPVKTIGDVAMTKPVASSIAFHQHGKELAITLEGDNLWFVHSIQVGSSQKLSVSPMATNQKSVQFNLQCKPDELAVTADRIKVVIESQFFEPISSLLKVTKKVCTHLYMLFTVSFSIND